MRNRFAKNLVLIVVIAALGAGLALAQAPKKQAKDQEEYNLYSSILKETNAQKKLELLTTWEQKYPNSDFKLERNQIFLATYQQLGQAGKMVDVAKKMLADNPKDFRALYLITALTPSLNNTAPEALEAGEKAATSLLSNPEKPADLPDDAWAKAKVDAESKAHKTLGWVAMQHKQNDVAEKEFTASLKGDANNGEVSYWLGLVILAQKKPERQSEVLYHFARAAAYEGPGALAPEARKTIDAYFAKAYTTYHGKDEAGLAELKKLAATQAFPPEGFHIKNVNEIAAENEQEFAKQNPAMAMWMNLKKELTGANGGQYFESSLKNAHIPGGAGGVQKFRGTLISSKPPTAPKELVLGVVDPNTPDVTLVLETPMRGKADAGTVLEFEGVVSAFSKEPFMLTLDVDSPAKISGWPAAAPAAKKAAPGAKKAAPKKK